MKKIEVITCFIYNKTASNTTGNLRSTGDRLFSYNTCIAQWVDGGIIVNRTKYSSTTSHHQGMLERRLAGHIHMFPVFDVPKDTQYLNKENYEGRESQ